MALLFKFRQIQTKSRQNSLGSAALPHTLLSMKFKLIQVFLSNSELHLTFPDDLQLKPSQVTKYQTKFKFTPVTTQTCNNTIGYICFPDDPVLFTVGSQQLNSNITIYSDLKGNAPLVIVSCNPVVCIIHQENLNFLICFGD
jgi:hypothetical protein